MPMHPKAQRELFENLLVTYGLNFEAAYADLVEQLGEEDAVGEGQARLWAKHLTREEAKAASAELVAQAVSGQTLATRVSDFSKLERDNKLAAIDEAVLQLIYTAATDHNHEVFEPRDRIAASLKGAELVGTPTRVQARQGGGPKAAHQAMPQLSHTFGTLPDRQVMVMFLQDGQDVVRLTNTLKVMDAQLSYLTPELVSSRLNGWRAQGVMMDAEQGLVMEWDDAVNTLQVGLRTLPVADELL